MASIHEKNGKFAVMYYEGDDRRSVMKAGLSLSQAEKLKERKDAEEEKWREQRKKERKRQKLQEGKTVVKNIITNNAGSNPTEDTVEEFVEDFIVKYGTKHWGDSYFTSSRSRMVNYVYPHFGQHRIVDVTTQMIDNYYNFLLKDCMLVSQRGSKAEKKHVTPALVHDIHKVLRTAFNQARRWKNIRENPFLDADIPKYKSKERPALSPAEFERILDYTDNKDDYDAYTIHLALSIQYYCTTRGGEVGGLQWPDYSPQKRTLHIFKALDRVDKKNLNLPKLKIYYTFPIMNPFNKTVTVLKAPKTEETERFSQLNNLMIEKLNHMKAMQEEMIENIFGKDYQDNQLIVCQSNGRPIMQEQLNRKFKAIIADMRANGHKFTSVPENLLEDVVFHSVRAASATKKMKVSNGNVKAVMKAGGWAEPDMVIRYSKDYDEDQVDIVNQMEKDYLNAGDSESPTDAETLLRIIQDNPELVAQLLATAKQV